MSKREKPFRVVEDKDYDLPGFSVVGPMGHIVQIYEQRSMAAWLATVLNYAYRCGLKSAAKTPAKGSKP